MTENQDVETGYEIAGIYAFEQHYETVGLEEVAEERQTQISWDWRITGDSSFAVYLSLTVVGSEDSPERVQVAYVAVFELSGSPQSLDLEDFVVINASALLIPYIRQAVSALTANGPFGMMNLSPVNVPALMDFVEFEKSTGSLQLADNPGLAAAFGYAPEATSSEENAEESPDMGNGGQTQD